VPLNLYQHPTHLNLGYSILFYKPQLHMARFYKLHFDHLFSFILYTIYIYVFSEVWDCKFSETWDVLTLQNLRRLIIWDGGVVTCLCSRYSWLLSLLLIDTDRLHLAGPSPYTPTWAKPAPLETTPSRQARRPRFFLAYAEPSGCCHSVANTAQRSAPPSNSLFLWCASSSTPMVG
jgi:hypothetical protein